jgi:hemolysin D
MIKILIVDDQLVVREKLQAALEKQPDFVVVGTAIDGNDAVDQAQLFQPDVVLLDIEMPIKNGLEAAAEIRQLFPGIRTVMLTSCDDVNSIRTALNSGAHGYLVKQQIDSSMMDMIRSVHKGHMQFGPGLLEKVLNHSETSALTHPQKQHNLQPSISGDLAPDHHPENNLVIDTTVVDGIEIFETEANSIASLSDWSNSAKEVIDGVPLPWTRGLFYCLLAFMAVAIPWAIFFQMDEIGTARGRLELAGDTIRREADIEGSVTVTKVLVKKGDVVKKGQVIMELDSRTIRDQIQQNQVKLEGQQQRLNQLGPMKNQLSIAVSTQQQQSQAQLLEKQAQIAQAQQSINGLKSNYNNQTTEKSAQLDQAAQTVIDRQNSLNAQKLEKSNQINQARQNVLDSTAANNNDNVRYQDAQREAARYKKLAKEGVISEVASLEKDRLAKESYQSYLQSKANLQQAQLRLKEQQDASRKTIQQAQADVQQAQLRLKEQQSNSQRNTSQLKSDVTQSDLRLLEQQRGLQNLSQMGKLAVVKSEQQLKELQSQMTALETEIEQSKNMAKSLASQLEKYTVRSNVDGTIFELPISREGAVLQPKQLIAEIAPPANTATDLVFKGEIPASQSESLRAQGIGKEVKLKFDEFPFETYGIVNGKVTWISPNSKVVATPTGNLTNYEVKVSLGQACIKHQKECLQFKSGQPATAEIIIRKRRIMDLIIDPFTKLKSS